VSRSAFDGAEFNEKMANFKTFLLASTAAAICGVLYFQPQAIQRAQVRAFVAQRPVISIPFSHHVVGAPSIPSEEDQRIRGERPAAWTADLSASSAVQTSLLPASLSVFGYMAAAFAVIALAWKLVSESNGTPVALWAAVSRKPRIRRRPGSQGARERDVDYLLEVYSAADEEEDKDDEDSQLIKKYEEIIFGDSESGDDDDDDDEESLLEPLPQGEAKSGPDTGGKKPPLLFMDTSAVEVKPQTERPRRAERAPRQKRWVRLVPETNQCQACGCRFQKDSPDAPGYLPPEKFALVWQPDNERDLGWTVQDEVTAILEEARRAVLTDPTAAAPADVASPPPLPPNLLEDESLLGDEAGKEDGTSDTEAPEPPATICQRCHTMRHKLKDFKDVLRSGWSNNDVLQPERFRTLLEPLHRTPCCVVMFVDLFDFHGSMLRDLAEIAGRNPVLIVVNKADLLPPDVDLARIRRWVWSECKRLNLRQLRESDIHLVSCKTGFGITALLGAMRTYSQTDPVYIVGAANVGKSSFINALVSDGSTRRRGAVAPQLVTASLVPGTTLGFLRVELRNLTLYDTPGIVMPHQLTSVLNLAEMKAVIPSKPIKPITLRVGPAQCVLVGAGLAQVEVLEGRTILLTFFVAPPVTLHLCKAERVPELVERHSGGLLSPPFDAERGKQLLADTQSYEFEVVAEGREMPAAVDLTIGGLGWIAVGGYGACRIRLTVPRGVQVRKRPPLLPYESENALPVRGTVTPLAARRQRPRRRAGA